MGQPLPHYCSSPEHLAQVGSRGWGRGSHSAHVLHVGSNALTQEGLQGKTGKMRHLLDHRTPSLKRGIPLLGNPQAPWQSPRQSPGYPSGGEKCLGAVPLGSVLLLTPPGSVGRGSSSWQQRRAGAGEPSTGPSAAWREKKGQIREQAANLSPFRAMAPVCTCPG